MNSTLVVAKWLYGKVSNKFVAKTKTASLKWGARDLGKMID